MLGRGEQKPSLDVHTHSRLPLWAGICPGTDGVAFPAKADGYLCPSLWSGHFTSALLSLWNKPHGDPVQSHEPGIIAPASWDGSTDPRLAVPTAVSWVRHSQTRELRQHQRFPL